MRAQRTTGFRPSQVIDSVFRVCRVAEQIRRSSTPHFTLTLANERGTYEALIGRPAAGLASGDVVRVRGCFLRRGNELVLVICWPRHVRHQNRVGPDGNEENTIVCSGILDNRGIDY